MPVATISCEIKLHEPSSPLKKLQQSQHIADLGILGDKVECLDGPARNTCSQALVQTITQEEAVLACICNYGEVMGSPITACHTAHQQFPTPTNMLHTVLDKTMGQLMEMWHLLVNPKYKELWGKSYTNELGHLAQGIHGVSKGTDTIVFIQCKDILNNRKCNVMYA
jgi:hypothetical protein